MGLTENFTEGQTNLTNYREQLLNATLEWTSLYKDFHNVIDMYKTEASVVSTCQIIIFLKFIKFLGKNGTKFDFRNSIMLKFSAH